MTHLWIRAEVRDTEQRAPLVPADVARLVHDGVTVSVEESPQRIFDIAEYAAAGASITPTGSWLDAPADAVVVGIKELPEEPDALRHTHVYFAHAFKGQDGAEDLLQRFARGGGQLLDIEYLTLEGRRVVAFGRWAGYVGAALGVLALRGDLELPLVPTDRPTLDARLADGPEPNALVIGARGRSGLGAVEALAVAGATVTCWDRQHTTRLDHASLLDHDLLVNCVVSTSVQDAFVRPVDLPGPRRLSIVSDVTCDVTSELNLIPVNTEVTTWSEPTRRVHDQPPLDVIAIDNLPSLLPREASTSFSAELAPLFADLPGRTGAWVSAVEAERTCRGDLGG